MPDPLGPREREVLADALGDTHWTVLSVHALRSGRCRAFVIGDPSDFDAAVIEWSDLPGEPEGYGGPDGIWTILKDLPDWSSVLVDDDVAPVLAGLIRRDTGRSSRLYQDVAYVLDRDPPPDLAHPDVRLFTTDDAPLLRQAPKELLWGSHDRIDLLLTSGVAAGAIVEGTVVSAASCLARTPLHGDIGVQTLEAYRGRGYATAGAALVAQELRRAGQTPTWGTGEDNVASQRVATKLGFRQVDRNTYVIPEDG